VGEGSVGVIGALSRLEPWTTKGYKGGGLLEFNIAFSFLFLLLVNHCLDQISSLSTKIPKVPRTLTSVLHIAPPDHERI
jgi:hypothetical protein